MAFMAPWGKRVRQSILEGTGSLIITILGICEDVVRISSGKPAFLSRWEIVGNEFSCRDMFAQQLAAQHFPTL